MRSRKRALVIAYFFPPLGGAGVQRTLKFIRYLEPLGWDATVITTSSHAYGAHDPSLLEDVPPGTRVVRASALPLLRWLGFAANRMRLSSLYDLSMWPDGGRGWAPFAFVAAWRAALRERPEVILSTSAPYGAHLVGMLVSRLTGIPWVADFRDEWATNPHVRQRRSIVRLTRLAERAVTARARCVILAADYFRLEGLPPDERRRVVIMNGVDERDVDRDSTGPPPTRFVLAHVGTVYEDFDPVRVLRLLGRLVAQGEIEGERLEVRFVGSIWVRDFREPQGIAFVRTGYVSHGDALAEMLSATALLLYRPKSSLAPSGKLFEYLASGRPLLCVAHPDNLASRLVREWEAGVAAAPDNDSEIEAAILTLWRRWEQDGLPDQVEVRRRTLERYSRRAAAAQLAHVLDEVTGS